MFSRTAMSLALLAGLTLARPAAALGLGDIEVSSHLNQPFSATIPLQGLSEDEADSLKVYLASDEEFAQAGLKRQPDLATLTLSVEKDHVRIVSDRVMREPVVVLLVQASAGRSKLRRGYTVLLSPPGEPAPTAAAASLPVQAESAPPPPAPLPRQYGPVQHGETFWRIVAKLRRQYRSFTPEQLLLALYEANPQAFQGGIDGLVEGNVLQVPPEEVIGAVPPAEAYQRIQRLRSASAAIYPQRAAAGAVVTPAEEMPPAVEAAVVPVEEPLAVEAPVTEAPVVEPPPAPTETPPHEPRDVSAPVASGPAPAPPASFPPPWLLPAAGVLALALIAGVWRRRRQAAAAAVIESEMQLQQARERAQALREAAAASGRATAGEAPPPTAAPGVSVPVGVAAAAAVESEAVPAAPASIADPGAEADFHLAYGHYDQAARLLQDAIARHPGRVDLQVKLAETWFAAGRAAEFEAAARGLELLAGARVWSRLAAMGAELVPDSPLFSSERAQPEAPRAPFLSLDEFDLGDTPLEADPEIDIATDDEMGSRLDLARVYLDMGDPAMARSLLDEVLQQGDAAQQADAQALLKRLPG